MGWCCSEQTADPSRCSGGQISIRMTSLNEDDQSRGRGGFHFGKTWGVIGRDARRCGVAMRGRSAGREEVLFEAKIRRIYKGRALAKYTQNIVKTGLSSDLGKSKKSR